MKLLYMDFETYYDDQYSLRFMTPAEYILDPRYETIMLGVAEDDGEPFIVDGPDLPRYLKDVDPNVTATVTWNALFDNCILSWRYGWVPKRMMDPMNMARALYGHKVKSVSLANTSIFLKTGQKGTFIQNMKGLHRQDMIDRGLWPDACNYCMDDIQRMRANFKIMAPHYPMSERRVMDKVLRCAVVPRFRVNVPMLEQHLDEVRKEKETLLAASGVEKADINSTVRFAKVLRDIGVEVKFKKSGTGKDIPALAKTDEFMAELQDHPDPQVQALAAARLGLKSTIEETRCERLLNIARLDWSCYRPGNWLPVPLRLNAAHTFRLGGDWKINLQNLPSGRGGVVTKLRKSIVCGPDEEVIAIDLSQIEARITAWLCNDFILLDQFANKRDPYAALACQVFDLPSVAKDSLERFIGKSGILGLGFGCGAAKFFNMVVQSARRMGMDMSKLMSVWSEGLAKKTVDTYRTVHSCNVIAWRELDQILDTTWAGRGNPVGWPYDRPVVTIDHGAVELPNGMVMRYQPECTNAAIGLTYTYWGEVHRIYGPKFLENIVQALARIVIMNAALRCGDRGYEFALQEHDALAFVVPKNKVDEAKQIIYEEVTRRPSWLPGIALAADIGSGPSYGEAK